MEPAVIINLNWVIVERATTFFMSVSQSDLVPPMIKVKLDIRVKAFQASVEAKLIISRWRHIK